MTAELTLDLLLIFVLRTLDVGIATVRIVLLGRGRRALASGLGFVEAVVWVVAVSRVLQGLDDPARLIAFAAGFAMGTYVGSLVEEWLALGQALIRVVAPVDSPMVAPELRRLGLGATVLNGDGMDGEVRLTFSVVERKRLPEAVALVHRVNPEAYVTIDQTAALDPAARLPRVRR